MTYCKGICFSAYYYKKMRHPVTDASFSVYTLNKSA
nr:MAG TPA: hypothetical protein [Caudoviricetes sp.]